MAKDDLTKAQRDLVDHIEAGQQYPKLVKILTEENKALKKNRSLDTMDEIAYRELEQKYKEAQEALANSLEVSESHQKLNGKLQMRITELEQDNLELHADNKKISKQVEDQLDRVRKAGM